MRFTTACVLTAALASGFAQPASACGYHHHVAKHAYWNRAPDSDSYRARTPDNTGGDGCAFQEREQPYINGCGEYIPSDSGPGPGNG